MSPGGALAGGFEMKRLVADEKLGAKYKIRRWQLIAYLEAIIIIELAVLLLIK